jgi:hypothetical protein
LTGPLLRLLPLVLLPSKRSMSVSLGKMFNAGPFRSVTLSFTTKSTSNSIYRLTI